LKLPCCIFTVAEIQQSKAVISFEERNWKMLFSGFAISHALWTIFSCLSHVHLRPFSFILNPKAVKCLHTFEI
jgi:hypothetical protein